MQMFLQVKKKTNKVGVLRRPRFLFKALRLPKKLDLRRTLIQKKCRRIGNLVNFSSIYQILHQKTLGRSVNQHWTKSVTLNQSNFIFTL